MKDLIDAYESYIKLLGEEISDLFGIARVHGWSSDPEHIKRGEDCRVNIAELKAKYENDWK